MASATYTNVIRFPVVKCRRPAPAPEPRYPDTIEERVALIIQGYREAMAEMQGAEAGIEVVA